MTFFRTPGVTVTAENSDVMLCIQEALAATAIARPRPAPLEPAIENKPLVGGEIHIRLSLSPATITLLAGPAAVLVTMLAGWMLLKSIGMPVYHGEMVSGALVNTIGGLAGALPLFFLMKRGAAAIAQAGILGIALRCGTVLMGWLVASAAAWGLEKMPLVYWVMGFYFPLLIVETAVVAWLSQKAKH